MNLLGDKKEATYIATGTWSAAAIKEAKKYCEVKEAAKVKAYTTIPK